MEMTIDTAITILGMVEAHGICIEAKDIAVETMCKYQKIEEAYTKYLNDVVTNIYADKKFVSALEEIFENGNDD